MAISFWVMLGSALGGLARYWLGLLVTGNAGAAFPWGTLLINVLGSFVIGLFATMTSERGLLDVTSSRLAATIDLRAFVMVGLCGGFTTFSAFSLQTFELLQAGRHGAALLYTLGSVVSCVLAAWAGWLLGQG